MKRTAFSLLACLAWHDKKTDDDRFIEELPLIVQASIDERNFVKKSVNWALRNIGKRNLHLNQEAIETARKLKEMNSKSARWIGSDALRELAGDAVQKRLNKS